MNFIVGIKKKVQYAPIGETLEQREARRNQEIQGNFYMVMPVYDINKIEKGKNIVYNYFLICFC